MAIDYSKFDKMIDVNGLKEDVKSAKEGSGEFKDVPHGTYEVEIDKLDLVETGPNSSNPGSPMVICWFKILEGEFKGQRIFMNQVVTQGFQIHIVNEFLRSLNTSVEVDFDNFVQYHQMLLDVHEDVDGKYEYALEYGENKGFNTFKIKEVFELED